jgi:hypothetical protein
MASSKELEDYRVFDDRCGDQSDFLHADVDSQFVFLQTVTGSNGDCLTVNEKGLDSFLSRLEEDPVPVLIHDCVRTDSTYNSSLISKLLGFTKKNFSGTANSSSQRIAAEELSPQVFSKHREKVTQQCIVAWAEPIKGESSEGEIVSHVFLDIWGKLKNDPVTQSSLESPLPWPTPSFTLFRVSLRYRVQIHFYHLIVLFCHVFDSRKYGTLNESKMLTLML